MNKKITLSHLSLALVLIGLQASVVFGATDYVRVNQVGYLTTDTKVAIAFANSSLSTLTFSVINNSGGAVLWGPTAFPATSSAYLPFSNVYQLDFSSYQPSSAVTCYIQLSDGTKSVNFSVGPCIYQNTEETALNFFRGQNCGTGNWYSGGNCHMAPGTSGFTSDKDGIVVDGPNAGTLIDVEGGWHDSGDWIKFMITTAWVDQVLLFSYQENPTVFQDTLNSNLQASSSNSVPDILDEARYALNWIIKMNPNSTTFYYDVADGRDHDNFGNLPQNDTESYHTAGVSNEGNGDDYGTVTSGYRAVYGGANDKGGTNNCARAAAALAMGFQIWNASGTSFQDTTFAGSCLTHAEQLYALGKAQNSLQNDVDDFYDENDMNPELEMAAVQLYKATGTASYLTDAQSYASAAGSAGGELDWNQNNFLAHYCLYQVAPTTTIKGYMQADLNADLSISNANPYGLGYDYVWGTNENVTSLVMMCQLWKKMFPTDTTYDKMATWNRDFLLGRNPWGVCFIMGMGTVYPKHPQHNIAMAIYPSIIPGMPIEGPDTYKEYKSQGISLSNGTDVYSAFNNNATGGGWCYHDDNEDYVTNEVTTTHAGFVVNIFADLAAASCSVAVTPSNTPTVTPTKTNTLPPTITFTPTKTNTPVPPTNTFTGTPTNSPTTTISFTPTKTNSPTYTPVPPTNTFTSTSTNTPVPPTNTFTHTPVPPTNTYTNSPTNTWTSTKTNTSTNTAVPPTNTYTNTPVPPTITNTPVPPTNTFTSTNTPVGTLTPTNSFTNTPVPPTNSFTPTSTNSSTPTPVPPTATFTNTAIPPSNSFTNTPVPPTPTFTLTSTFTFTRTNTLPPTATSSATPSFTATSTRTATSTSSFTATSTFSSTATSSYIPTRTFTKTFTATSTGTPTVTATSTTTFTKTPTNTSTPSAHGTAVVYPNPVSGPGPVYVTVPLTSSSNIEITLFTTAFRKVNDLEFRDVQPGTALPVPLTNRYGHPLADGLYYLKVETRQGRYILKLLILG